MDCFVVPSAGSDLLEFVASSLTSLMLGLLKIIGMMPASIPLHVFCSACLDGDGVGEDRTDWGGDGAE